MERAMGIEPTAQAWEAWVLPLYDARYPFDSSRVPDGRQIAGSVAATVLVRINKRRPRTRPALYCPTAKQRLGNFSAAAANQPPFPKKSPNRTPP
jgi:hypothetical protein